MRNRNSVTFQACEQTTSVLRFEKLQNYVSRGKLWFSAITIARRQLDRPMIRADRQ